MKALLRNKLYMTTLTADMLSNFGDILFYLALMNYVIALPDAKFAISIISVSEMLPTLVSVVVGSWADKTQRKLTMIFNTIAVRAIIYVLVGLLMGFSPALWIVIAVAILNFFSDICGQYESGLFIPISLKIVSDEMRESSIAFRQTVSLSLNVVFRSLSALLVALMSYQALAFVNAGTFILSALILLSIRSALAQLLAEPPAKQTTSQPVEENNHKRSLFEQINYTFQHFKNKPDIYSALLVIPFINAVFSVVGILILFYISIDKHFVVINSQTTLAIFPILITLSGIVGSSLAMTLFQSLSMNTVLKFSSLFGVGIFVGFLYHNIIVVLVCLCFAVVLGGAASPKFSAAILNHLPQDSLATALSGINTLLQLGIVGMTLLVSWFITFLTANTVTLICLLPAVLVACYLWFFQQK